MDRFARCMTVEPGHDADESLRMTAEPDAKLIEQGRKLFAGDWRFIWASPSIETLPPMAGIEVAFAGRSNVGKSSLINALTGRNALARTSHHAGPHPGTDLLRRPRHMPASGWSTCPATATPPRRRPRSRPGPR